MILLGVPVLARAFLLVEAGSAHSVLRCILTPTPGPLRGELADATGYLLPAPSCGKPTR
jgi:hypothetical protein